MESQYHITPLVDLFPRWERGCGRIVGISFQCPHCTERIEIPFEGVSHCFWYCENEDYRTLSVVPSINISGHVHGHIIRGEVKTVSCT